MGRAGDSPDGVKSYGFFEMLQRFHAYRRYWLAMAVSWAGDRFSAVALATLVLDRFPHQPMAIGIVLMMQHLPQAVFGLLAGALADRWPRRRVMVASDLVRAAVVLLVPFADQLWQVYLAALALGTASTFFFPAWRSTLPAVVSRDALLEANAYHSATRSFVDILAPVGATALIAAGRALHPVLYMAPAFWLDSLSYLISAWQLAGLALDERARAGRAPARGAAGVWQDVVAGLRYHRQNRTVWALLLLMGSFAWGANGANALMQKAVPALLQVPPERWGVLLAAMGAGMIAGNAVVARRGKVWPRRVIIGTGYLGAWLALVILAGTRDFEVAMVAYVLMGVSNAAFLAPQVAWVQEATDPAYLGRVEATRNALIYVGMTASPLLAGWLEQALGSLPGAMWGISVLFLVPAVLSFVHPALRQPPAPVPARAASGA
ncbi:arabinose efflux permease family protein [Thermaerobacter subterraneus DSM 13965]|uniref:Arabinose efflux permease family protein n=1 Tax=Thermaerobacter subterraneus DSM 13965 TaxID=867903 RepID=K6QFN8_9FIRM|nr:arabinose efflux permease family protein [Thermaerobacter subterraneus DSM 13965]